MCVVNKNFELLEFVFNFVYVDLMYNEIYLTFTAGSVNSPCIVWCVWSCGRPVSVCEVGSVPYVSAMGAVTVMRVLLFVLHVCMLRECEGDGNVGVWDVWLC